MRTSLTTQSALPPITSIALTIGFFTFIAKILGVIRNSIFSGTFGAGDTMDIYFAAFLIPDFIYSIFITGLISTVFIPVFAQYRAIAQEEAWKLTRSLLVFFTYLLGICALIGIGYADTLLSIVVPGFDPVKRESTVLLMRIMFMSPILLGISNIIGSVLQVHKVFFSFALAPVMYNIGIMIGVLFFTPHFGIQGLAWGVVLGALLHLLIQLPSLYACGFVFRGRFAFFHAGLRKIMFLAFPRMFGLVVYQFHFVIITALASVITPGSITIFNLANDLQFVPIGIIALSLSNAVFPFLATSMAEGKKELFLTYFSVTIHQILFYIIPFSVLLILERAQIIRVLFGYGNFSWADTRLTAAALGAFALSLFAQALIPLFSRAFYALENTKIPVLINSISVGINVALSFFFLHMMQNNNSFADIIYHLFKIIDVPGREIIALPLAFSFAAILNFLFLYLAFSFYLHAFEGTSLLGVVNKINIATFGMTIVVYGSLFFIAPLVNIHTVLGIIMQGGIAFLIGILVYGALSYWLGIPECTALCALLSRTRQRCTAFLRRFF